jgi:hypothetical protein
MSLLNQVEFNDPMSAGDPIGNGRARFPGEGSNRGMRRNISPNYSKRRINVSEDDLINRRGPGLRKIDRSKPLKPAIGSIDSSGNVVQPRGRTPRTPRMPKMGRRRPEFGTVADQRAANAEAYARRGINQPRPNFGTIAEQRANSAERVRARGGNMNNSPRPAFASIADQRAANAEAYARRGVNVGPRQRPDFGTIAEQRARAASRRAGAGTGAIDDVVRNAPNPTAPAREAAERVGKKGFLKNGRRLAIGAGAAVVAGLAYSGRRGEGSSGGRTSMSRY